MNSLMIPQSIALTITPQGHPLNIKVGMDLQSNTYLRWDSNVALESMVNEMFLNSLQKVNKKKYLT